MLCTITYYSSLAICVVFASNYRNIEDVQTKKNYGTGAGMIVAVLICGTDVYHSMILVAVNILIIQYCDKRYLSSLSFMLNWTYLFYIHYKCCFRSLHLAWFYQNMVLRLVGLAFEIDMAEKSKLDPRTTMTTTNKLPVPTKRTDVNPVDIINYAYFFTGIHKGPYYKWRTFEDHFNTPYSTLGDCRIITEEMMKKACFLYATYITLAITVSTKMYNDPKFYTHTTDFMFLSNLPHLLMYVLKHQAIMFLATSVFSEAGFGLYPSKALALPGMGPTVNVPLTTADAAVDQEYNYSMLKCYDNDKLIFGPRMKDSLRGWDLSKRYWFWAYIYKSLSKGKKEVRSSIAFLAWTIWWGPSIPHLLTAVTLWVYVNLETEYAQLFPVTTSKKLPWEIGYSIMRIFCLLYLTPCFILTDTSTIMRYYNSIYWIFHVVILIFLTVAGAAAINTKHQTNATAPIVTAATE